MAIRTTGWGSVRAAQGDSMRSARRRLVRWSSRDCRLLRRSRHPRSRRSASPTAAGRVLPQRRGAGRRRSRSGTTPASKDEARDRRGLRAHVRAHDVQGHRARPLRGSRPVDQRARRLRQRARPTRTRRTTSTRSRGLPRLRDPARGRADAQSAVPQGRRSTPSARRVKDEIRQQRELAVREAASCASSRSRSRSTPTRGRRAVAIKDLDATSRRTI